MRTFLSAGLAAGAVLALAAAAPPAGPPVANARQGSGLTAELAGTWTGHRTISPSGKAQQLRMVWRKAADGRMVGTMAVVGEKYPVNVVWSSDTAFIAESAPHHSHVLREMVVTRSEAHFKAGKLVGTFEARPTTYSGRTMKGSFEAIRS
jgi:hypothetical protein